MSTNTIGRFVCRVHANEDMDTWAFSILDTTTGKFASIAGGFTTEDHARAGIFHALQRAMRQARDTSRVAAAADLDCQDAEARWSGLR